MYSKNDIKILIFGRVPPPFGGVTVHIKRLIDNLNFMGIDARLYGSLFDFFIYPIWHIHTNNSYKRFLLVFLGRILLKKTIITLHRDYKRDGGVRFFINYLSFLICSSAVVLNLDSYNYFIRRKFSKVHLLSSFIEPVSTELSDFPLRGGDVRVIKEFVESGRVYCTCAHHLRYFKENDIYGISEIVEVFRNLSDQYLILSDPSGEYTKKFTDDNISLPKNVHVINYQHSFLNVLVKSDFYIRNTSTDGDSLSIHEALYYGKDVLCTDVVSRPEGCCVYSLGELKIAIESCDAFSCENKNKEDTIKKLIGIYEN